MGHCTTGKKKKALVSVGAPTRAVVKAKLAQSLQVEVQLMARHPARRNSPRAAVERLLSKGYSFDAIEAAVVRMLRKGGCRRG